VQNHARNDAHNTTDTGAAIAEKANFSGDDAEMLAHLRSLDVYVSALCMR
jgi:hypothetical protein